MSLFFFSYLISQLFYSIRKKHVIAYVTAVFVKVVFCDEDKILMYKKIVSVEEI